MHANMPRHAHPSSQARAASRGSAGSSTCLRYVRRHKLLQQAGAMHAVGPCGEAMHAVGPLHAVGPMHAVGPCMRRGHACGRACSGAMHAVGPCMRWGHACGHACAARDAAHLGNEHVAVDAAVDARLALDAHQAVLLAAQGLDLSVVKTLLPATVVNTRAAACPHAAYTPSEAANHSRLCCPPCAANLSPRTA